jgi:predicted nucleic acid-binding protein
MFHVFVETNWLHAYAAPAHHKVPAAVALLERAQRGEFMLHIPNVSIFKEIAGLSCVNMFALDDEMLNLANQLSLTKVAQKPFDHAILAG